MIFRVITQPRAEAEAEEAFRWIYEQSPAAAVRWYRGLSEAIESLATSPQRCALAPENEFFEPEIRQLLFGRRRGVYRILFTIRGDVVSVLSVLHGARQTARYLPVEDEGSEGEETT
jgi:plasmid stabilization system protein ParE